MWTKQLICKIDISNLLNFQKHWKRENNKCVGICENCKS